MTKTSSVIASTLVLSACASCSDTATWTDRNVGQSRMSQDAASSTFRGSKLTFAKDGRLSGFTGCNRLSASYRVEKRSVVIDDAVATTGKACVEALMSQERAFVDIIRSIDSYDFDQTNALLLKENDEIRLIARKAGG